MQGLSGADLSGLRAANLEVAVARVDRGHEHLLSDRERSQVAEHRTAKAERQKQIEQERTKALERERESPRRSRGLGLGWER